MPASDNRRENIKRIAAYFDRQAPDPELEEYEVIDAYDIAGDNDAYAQLQERILDYGLRRFPDSESLLIRQAFLLYDNYENEKALQIAAKVSGKSTLRQLFDALLLHDKGADDAEVFDSLEMILSRHKEFADEEMIKFLSTAMELDGGFDWLVSKIDTLRLHTSYPQVLFYEMAQYARDENRADLAERYVEELTMIDPFEIDFWEMLAEVHIANGKYEEARQDIDYALAISPDSGRSRLLNANLRLLRGDDITDVLAEIDDLVFSEGPLDSFPLYVAISALDSQDQSDKASVLLTKYIEKFPTNRGAIDLLVSRTGNSDQTKATLDRFFAATDDHTVETWQAWANDHFDHCDYDGTLAIIEAAMRGGIRLTSHLSYVQALYFTNQAAGAVQYIINNKLLSQSATSYSDEFTPQVDAHIITSLVMIMSLIRTGGDKLAIQIIDEELSIIKTQMIQGQLLHNIGLFGYRETLRNIRKHLRMDTYPDSYDPLLMPQNLANTRRSKA